MREKSHLSPCLIPDTIDSSSLWLYEAFTLLIPSHPSHYVGKSIARKRDDQWAFPRRCWHRHVHGRTVVRLACPTLSPMMGRHTLELETGPPDLERWDGAGITRTNGTAGDFNINRVPPAYPRSAIQAISAIPATRETAGIQGSRSCLADSPAFTPWISSVRAR